jgi:4-hydroxybenzoate polyprenyltransferase
MSMPDTSRAWRGYLELVRPPNVATALGDVLAGFAIAGLAPWAALPWLLVATACLYAGGVALNDVCDRAIDAEERPERPLPSGRVSVAAGRRIAIALLLAGVTAAAFAGVRPAMVALVIVALVVLYDTWGKRQPAVGPINMGLCRGANLLLGAAVTPDFFELGWRPALLVTVYIASITLLSRAEVAGGARRTAAFVFGLGLGVTTALAFVSLRAVDVMSMTGAMALTALFGWRVLSALWAVCRTPEPQVIRYAVKTGVLSLVLADGIIAASYAGMIYCLALLATAFLAGRLARAFAVT